MFKVIKPKSEKRKWQCFRIFSKLLLVQQIVVTNFVQFWRLTTIFKGRRRELWMLQCISISWPHYLLRECNKVCYRLLWHYNWNLHERIFSRKSRRKTTNSVRFCDAFQIHFDLEAPLQMYFFALKSVLVTWWFCVESTMVIFHYLSKTISKKICL